MTSTLNFIHSILPSGVQSEWLTFESVIQRRPFPVAEIPSFANCIVIFLLRRCGLSQDDKQSLQLRPIVVAVRDEAEFTRRIGNLILRRMSVARVNIQVLMLAIGRIHHIRELSQSPSGFVGTIAMVQLGLSTLFETPDLLTPRQKTDCALSTLRVDLARYFLLALGFALSVGDEGAKKQQFENCQYPHDRSVSPINGLCIVRPASRPRYDIGPCRKQCVGQDYCALRRGMLKSGGIVEGKLKGSLCRENSAARVGL